MPAKNKTIERQALLALIGRQIVFQQQQCEIVELLDDCIFVLQVLENDRNIQATQYGEGHRTVPVTYILPIFDGEGNLHAELLATELQNLLL
ncbi:MAG TPA: hypothetical protein DCZ98_04275 [Cryomorphaceae bacterium]|nr:hypothetical protein [Cryomorphaceae bacterium]